MSIFRKINSSSNVPVSPSLLFRDLRRKPNIKFLWDHQGKMLDEYFNNHLNSKNLALELPTGSGKTLVGLLIAEYQRKAKGKRVVYLCPTRQLCHQVYKQATSYGIECSLLIGQQQNYDANSFSRYQRGLAVAITTYSGIFNSNPKIDDPEIIICDDAHAADGYIADLWTLKINKSKHPTTFQALTDLLGDAIPANIRGYIDDSLEIPNKFAVDIMPFHLYAHKIQDILNLFNTHFTETDHKFSWSKLNGHLEACNFFVSPNEFFIRPLIPPTKSHSPFANAEQRVFMSATLGDGGDLERITGIRKIERLPIPPGWDKLGSGRRLLLFTNLLSTSEGPSQLVDWMISKSSRTLILVEDERNVEKFITEYSAKAKVFRASDVENSIETFTESEGPSFLILANRYDGIDLPGDDCRETILFGVPTATNLQEKFFYQRLGASSQLRDRIRTRITQGIGRCTRDENDFALVLLAGNDILKWFSTKKNTKGLHPEIQAEVQFGLEQSEFRSVEEIVEISNAFLSQNEDWVEANQSIIQLRESNVKQIDDVSSTLEKSVNFEIDFIYAMWNHDFERAYEMSTKATEALSGGTDLKPYRAFWHYAASVAGFIRYEATKNELWKNNFLDHIRRIQGITTGVTWLPGLKDLAGLQSNTTLDSYLPNPLIVDNLLEDWHIVGTKFERKLNEARSNIYSDESTKFERGLETLGKMLGYQSLSWGNDTAAPDGYWEISSNLSLVFEAKSDESPENPISVSNVRQAGYHASWLHGKNIINKERKLHTVLITHKSTISETAHSMANDIYFAKVDSIRQLFNKVATVLNEIRLLSRDISEEKLHELIIEKFTENKLLGRKIIEDYFSVELKSLPIIKD
jgi:hypothetical protein